MLDLANHSPWGLHSGGLRSGGLEHLGLLMLDPANHSPWGLHSEGLHSGGLENLGRATDSILVCIYIYMYVCVYIYVPLMPGLICHDPLEVLRAAVPRPEDKPDHIH